VRRGKRAEKGNKEKQQERGKEGRLGPFLTKF